MDQDPRIAPAAMTRSAERLHVGTRPVAIGRAVLRRVVVIEERTVTVQVRHEEVRLEIVPFDEPVALEDLPRAAHLALPELTLHREEVVVTTRVVPVERVRLQITPVTEQRSVTAQLREERIDLETTEGPEARGSASPPSA